MKKLLVAALLVAASVSSVQAEEAKANIFSRSASAVAALPTVALEAARKHPVKTSVAVAALAAGVYAVYACPEVREFLGLDNSATRRCSIR